MSGFNNYGDKNPGTGYQGAHIGLSVKDQYGIEVFFTMKRSSKLKKLLNVYCDRQFVDVNSTSFLFGGRSIRGEQTPHQLHMEEGDKIHAILHQSEEHRVHYDQQLAINIDLEKEITRLRKGSEEDALLKMEICTKIVSRLVNQLITDNITIKEELKKEIIRLRKDEGEDAALIKIGRDVFILVQQLLEENVSFKEELSEEIDKLTSTLEEEEDDEEEDDDEEIDEEDDELFIFIGRIASELLG
ncbi:hypothetical protein R6Q57_025974 [Mikania cordata]